MDGSGERYRIRAARSARRAEYTLEVEAGGTVVSADGGFLNRKAAS